MDQDEIERKIKEIKEKSDNEILRLREKAKEIKQKNLIKLGNKTLDFLKGKIGKDELKSFATDNKLMKQISKNETKSDDESVIDK